MRLAEYGREDATKQVREFVDAVYRSRSRQGCRHLIRLLDDFDAPEEPLHDASPWQLSDGRAKEVLASPRRGSSRPAAKP